MNSLTFKKASVSRFIALAQVLLLVAYLTLNILNVGGGGAALPLLAGFLVFSGVNLLLAFSQVHSAVRMHFFVFLLFVAWLALRVLVDLQDIEYLKQITVATTSGILLFFLVGTFVRDALDKIILAERCVWLRGGLSLFLLASFLVFLDFNHKLLDGGGVFYMDGVEGDYQRPGNFMIFSFVMCSFVYLVFSAHPDTGKKTSLFLWFVVYTLIMLLNLISSQAMGANTATACVLAVYLITAVFSFLFFNEILRKEYVAGRLIFPWSKLVFKKIFKYSVVVMFFGMTAAFVFLQVTGFDLQKTRVFGFGTGENTSVNSRLEILQETGFDQVGYSPVFGNVDVARLTTGDAGRTLHSFIPNVFAELGFVGLFIVLVLCSLVMINLLNLMRCSERNEFGFVQASIAFWLFLVFMLFLLYSNLAVGKEWSVIWFFIGFSVSILAGDGRCQKTKDLNVGCGV